jgi:hypothetical protein
MPLSGHRHQDGEHASAPPWSSSTCKTPIIRNIARIHLHSCAIRHIHTQPLLHLGTVQIPFQNEGSQLVLWPYRYCKEGHEFFAAKGLAPNLHAGERLPGGLYMVVMVDVSEEYVSLFDLVQDNLDLL